MTPKQSWPRVLPSVLIGLQQLNLRPPRAVRALLLSFLAAHAEREFRRRGIRDWSTPLIEQEAGTSSIERIGNLHNGVIADAAEGKAVDVQTLEAESFVATQEASAGGPSKTCMLVTSTLDVGGTEEVVAFMARNFLRHGFRTTVLHAISDSVANGVPRGRLGKALAEKGIETVALDPHEGRKWIEKRRPDVVSAHYPPLWVLEAAADLSIPCVEVLHGMHVLFNTNWTQEAQRSAKLARIVSVSELLREQYLLGNPNFPADRIITVPNGTDLKRRPLRKREVARASLGLRQEFLFVSLGRHCVQKNPYGLVSAFEDVAAQHRHAHLVIAGRVDEPAYFLQVQRLRDSLKCRDRVHLRDNIADPERLLAAADAVVLNSFFEGWALASMEALCAGVPVVVSDVGGAREQVGSVEQRRGHLVPNPVGDPVKVNWDTIREVRFQRQANHGALVSAMSSLISEQSAWLGARDRLIGESAKRFHPDVCLGRHAQVLRDVIREA
jgi:glycosyltransferase involved in cell wall biosynthesis